MGRGRSAYLALGLALGLAACSAVDLSLAVGLGRRIGPALGLELHIVGVGAKSTVLSQALRIVNTVGELRRLLPTFLIDFLIFAMIRAKKVDHKREKLPNSLKGTLSPIFSIKTTHLPRTLGIFERRHSFLPPCLRVPFTSSVSAGHFTLSMEENGGDEEAVPVVSLRGPLKNSDLAVTAGQFSSRFNPLVVSEVCAAPFSLWGRV